MSRRLRFVVGLTVLLALATGSFAPAAARTLPKTHARSASTTIWWTAFVRWIYKEAQAPLSTTFAYGTDAPLTPLSSSSESASVNTYIQDVTNSNMSPGAMGSAGGGH